MGARKQERNLFIKPGGISVVKYDLYFKFEQEYDRVVNAYHNAFAEMQSDPEGLDRWPEMYSDYCDKISVALAQWKEFGYKNEVEFALSDTSVLSSPGCCPPTMKSVLPRPALFSLS